MDVAYRLDTLSKDLASVTVPLTAASIFFSTNRLDSGIDGLQHKGHVESRLKWIISEKSAGYALMPPQT